MELNVHVRTGGVGLALSACPYHREGDKASTALSATLRTYVYKKSLVPEQLKEFILNKELV